MNRKGINIAVSAIFVFVVVFVFIMPILRLVLMSLTTDDGLSIQNFVVLLAQERTREAILNTLLISVLSTVIAVVFGSLFAFLVAYTNISNKRWIELLVLAPYIIPSYVITLSWSEMLSSRGLINSFLTSLSLPEINIYSLPGIILVMGICNVPVVYLIVINMLRKIPKDMEWAARVSGYGLKDVITKITLKLASPAIASGGVLAFLASIDNFSIPAFLGISAGIPVLSTYIYENAISFGSSSFNLAAALSILLSVIALGGSLIQLRFVAKGSQMESVKEDYSIRVYIGKKKVRVINFVLMFFLICINIVPLLGMMVSSFYNTYGTRLTLENFEFVFTNQSVRNSVFNSVFLTLLTCVVCIVIGTTIAYLKVRKNSKVAYFIESSASLTYALPGIVLALAMIFHWGKVPGVYGTIKILVIAYITRYMILQIKGSTTALLSVESSLEEAARMSGSKPVHVWRKIIIPLITKPVLSSSFLIFVSACSELTLSSMLAAANTKTIGLTIFNLKQGGSYSYSYAMSTVMVVVIVFLYFVANRPKKGRK